MRVLAAVILAGLPLAAVAGCGVMPGVPTAIEQPAPAPDPEPGEQDPAESSPDTGLLACTPDQRGGMERTVRAQTEAFSDGDFEEAYAYASSSFQASVPLVAFEQIIRGSYGPLVISADLRFGECLVASEDASGTIDARFSNNGTDVVGLRYVMVEENAGWRVDGASNLTIVGQGS
mgnify:CR=1 FL=1